MANPCTRIPDSNFLISSFNFGWCTSYQSKESFNISLSPIKSTAASGYILFLFPLYNTLLGLNDTIKPSSNGTCYFGTFTSSSYIILFLFSTDFLTVTSFYSSSSSDEDVYIMSGLMFFTIDDLGGIFLGTKGGSYKTYRSYYFFWIYNLCWDNRSFYLSSLSSRIRCQGIRSY